MIYAPMIIYWLVFAVYSIRVYSLRASDENYRFFMLLMLLSVAAFILYYVGFRPLSSYGDTVRYVWAYNGLTSFGEARQQGEDYFGNGEWLFWVVAYLFKSVGFDARGWLALMSILPGVVIAICYRSLIGDRLWLVLFSALYLSYYIVFCGAVRQAVAESLVLLALVFSIRGAHVRSIVVLAIAVGFHQSAMIGFVFPILVRINASWRLLVFVVFSCLVLSAGAAVYIGSAFESLGLSSAADKMTMYSLGESGEFGNLFHHKQFLLLFSVCVLYLMVNYNRQARGLYNYVVYILFLIFLFWSVPVLSGRMMGYLTIIFPILVYGLMESTVGEKYRLFIYSLGFGFLGVFVLSADSTQFVLGLR